MQWWRLLCAVATLGLSLVPGPLPARAQDLPGEICSRPAAGSVIPEPEDLRSQDGVLKVELTYRSFRDTHGQMRYCYQYKDGSQAPNLRLKPGDWLVLTLKNDLKSNAIQRHASSMAMSMSATDRCGGGSMDGWSTNLHFHGLTVPPVCHQDDVLYTMIGPGDPPFEYRFQIPTDEPPGLYWYHPHVHGFSNAQVLGGASGALIVEGIERANGRLGELPERVLIIRDQELLNPDAAATPANVDVPVLRDAEGDVLNTGTGGGKPAKDLSLNFVPVPYPDYVPGVIAIRPGALQLWRVLNASAITYVDLQVLSGGSAQALGIVSLDGVPISESALGGNQALWRRNVLLPPAGRVDFIFKGPPENTRASLVTRAVDTGPAGENDPIRPLATIVSRRDAQEPRSKLPAAGAPVVPQSAAGLVDLKPVRQRKLYFSERPSDPNDPKSPTVFCITIDGQDPVPYDPRSTVPNITVQQGDVEDWVIENRSRELHAFHIHQIHFLLTEYDGVPVNEPFLRDTVNVPYWDGGSSVYPSVKLRMDFRNPHIVGTFVYHCHLLEHEDGGMMGTIRVEPRRQTKRQTASRPAVVPSVSKIPSSHPIPLGRSN